MPTVFVSVGQVIFVFALVFCVSSIIQAVVYKTVLNKLATIDNNWRSIPSIQYLLYACLPIFIATLTTLILFNPSLIPNIITPHCHGQTCQPHSIVSSNSHAPINYLITFILVVVIATLVLLFRQIRLAKTYFNALDSFAKHTEQGYKIIQSDQKLAWCAGLIKPQIFISSELHKNLKRHQLAFVLAHELSHKLHRDNLKKWLVSWLIKVWPASIAQQFYNELNNTVEIEADLRALQQFKTADLANYQNTIASFCQCSEQTQRIATVAERFKSTHKVKTFIFRSLLVGLVMSYSSLLLIYFPKLLHPIIEWLS